MTGGKRALNGAILAGIAVLGAVSLATLALGRGEAVNALWLVTASLCAYTLGYRFYGRFVAARVVRLDPARRTPAVRRADGIDYVATGRVVLFGHHFAAIAGAGPLVGPVLAAQMGYLPGTLWLLTGAVFAGAVQDFLILVFSTRRDGRCLGDMIRAELGGFAGGVASLGVLAIMMILLAVLALIVVKALANSPWGVFTVAATMPIAILMGLFMRFVRPQAVLEISLAGVALLLGAIWLGGYVAASPVWAPLFTFSAPALAWMLMAYGFCASVLPVWLLLAPRDYLSTFLKIGTIAALAIGIAVTLPVLHMPAVTRFVDGSGPVFAGRLFPFLFITIACGAVSGFHALVSSGTTPKLLAAEPDALPIGYGAMLCESFVAIMAMVAACVLQPGAYFAMNAPAAIVGPDPVSVAQHVSAWGFAITPGDLTSLAHRIGETSILGRAGGAPTLAVGMAQIFSGVLGGPALAAFWYHFAILFEALFILTTIDAGTRVARFMLQDLAAPFARGSRGGWAGNAAASALAVSGWGYFLYQGVTDPLGGINTLWPLFGIANQMLAAIALAFCTAVLFRMKRERYAAVAALPAGWLAICTLTAGAEKIFSANPAIGFLAHAARFRTALAAGTVIAPAHDLGAMHRLLTNDWVNVTMTALFMAVVVSTLAAASAACWRARASRMVTAREVGDDLPLLRPVI